MNYEEEFTVEEQEEIRECASHVPDIFHPVAVAIDDLLMKFRCAPYTEDDVNKAIEVLEEKVENCVPLQSLIILLGNESLKP